MEGVYLCSKSCDGIFCLVLFFFLKQCLSAEILVEFIRLAVEILVEFIRLTLVPTVGSCL